jgi:tumor protein p53-inducible protein 3
MRAVALRAFGDASVLHVVENAIKPAVGIADVLIRVKATAVNRADINQRQGQYPPPPGASDILGLECAGIVEAVGEQAVDRFSVGDRVMALLAGGGYAEYAAVDAGSVMPIPQDLSFTEAAAIPEAFLTAWQCLTFNASVAPGDVVLVHAGASGVGTAAAQLTQKVLGATAVTTSSADKVDFCKQYSQHAVSRSPNESGVVFADKVAACVGANRVNVVIDPVFGGPYLAENCEVAAMDSTVVVLAFMGGGKIPNFNAVPFFRKRCCIRFSTLRSRDPTYKAALVSSFASRALKMFGSAADAATRLQPVVSKVYKLSEVAQAHYDVETNASVGKIVLVMDE